MGKAGPSGTEQIASGYATAQGTQTSEAQAIKFDPSNLGKEGPTGTEQIAGSGQLPERRYYGLVRNTEHGTEPVYPQAQYYGDGYAQSIKFDPTKLGKEGPTGTERIMSFGSMDRREYINTDGLQQIIQNLTSIKQRLTSFSDRQRSIKESMHRAWNGTTGDKAYEKLNKYEIKYNKYIKMINKRIRFLRYVIDQYTIWDNEINQKIDDNFSKKM